MTKPSHSNPSIDLHLLELFVVIARSPTIAAAARQLNVSPSLASRKLAAMEATLDTRLFQRSTRALRLTEAGRATLDWAELVLTNYGELRDELSRHRQEPEGLLKIAVSDYVASVLLPKFLTDFIQRYPQIVYDIKTTDHLVNPIEQEFDVAIHSGFIPDSSLVGVPIKPVQRILCASPAYLLRTPALDEPQDLANHLCITHAAAEPQEWFFQRNDVVTSAKIQHRLSIDSFLALLQFARHGIGIIRISSNIVRAELENGSLVHVLPDYRCVQQKGSLPSMWLIYPNRRLSYAARTFITEVRNYLEST